jgi:hypothetical protein
LVLKKWSFVQRWLLFTGCANKIAFNGGKLGIMLAIADGWSLLRGGRYHRFDSTVRPVYNGHPWDLKKRPFERGA